jgi:hypothetical protein
MAMLKRIVIATTVLGLVLPAVAFGQGFSEGDKVATLSGSGSSDNDLDNTDLSMEGAFSYFFTDKIEGAIRQGFAWIDLPGSDNDWAASTRVALDYNFDMGRVWPFVGGNFGYVYGDAVHDTWVAGPEAGVRVFVNPTTFIMGLVEYEFFFDDSDEIDDAFDDGRFVYTLGIGFRW